MNPFKSIAFGLVVWCMTVAGAVASETTFPDTLAGQRASAFIAEFNAGGDEAMRSFENEHRAASAARRRPLKDRVANWRNNRADWGKLTVRDILTAGERDIRVVAETARGDGWIHIDFELDDNPPHGLMGIRVEGPVSPKSSAASNKRLDSDSRARTVNRIADELARGYIFPDVGRKMADDIRRRLGSGAYDAIEYPYALAQRLTSDLRAICHDRHLRVSPRIPVTSRGERSTRNGGMGRKPADNYGFVKVEILPGNVGYIKFTGFAGTPDAQPTAAAAMAFVADADALIFDVTENGGGSPKMINFLCGYLFEKPVHLNSFENRDGDGVTRSETFSVESVPGKRFGWYNSVYVLTSSYTFSAAEEFTYDLKHLKRATVVGETTGGGAHPVGMIAINKYFNLRLPIGRAVNPITKTNWEGVGVIPHVEVPADEAKETAYRLAMAAVRDGDAAVSTRSPAGRR